MAKLAFFTEVRDCETYLPQAIESVLNQTFTDFDYYITDDGSTDGTREIIARYAARDSRIIPAYFDNDMAGNFNKTLCRVYASDANWFALLDSDDWYEPEFAEIMISLLENTGADLAEARFIAHDENGEDPVPGFGDALVSLKEFADQFAYFSFFDATQQWWGKVYRVPLLRRLRLTAEAGWDTEFVLRYRAACKQFAVCDKALHHYRIRQDSDCHKLLKSFDGERVAIALTRQHDAREGLFLAAGCQNPESRVMAALQDVNGVKSNMMRLYASGIPGEMVGAQLPHLLRLPFLSAAYEMVEQSWRERGRLFFAPPEESAKAMESIRTYYGLFLRMAGRYGAQGDARLIYEWLCRVFPHLEDFFELEDLPLLLEDNAVPILERRYRQALATLRGVGPEDEQAPLRAFACVKSHTGGAFVEQFRSRRAGALSPKKNAFLNLQTDVSFGIIESMKSVE